MLNKNMEYSVPERRETLLSTDIHSIGKKRIFKKFAMLLAPFVLASLGLLLTDSAVHAAEWTSWQKCIFTEGWGGSTELGAKYTWWRALITARSSDKAVRVIRFEYDSGTSERIDVIGIHESRIINGQNKNLAPAALFYPNNQTAWISPLLSSLPWVSTLYRPRYINVFMQRSNSYADHFCTSKTTF